MKNKRHKSHKVLICILLIIIILAIISAAMYIWQKNNIDAVISAAKYSEDDIQQQIVDSKQDVETELEQHDIVGLRDFTFEEEEQIRKGQLSVEDAMARIMEESGVADNGAAASVDNSSNLGNNITEDNKGNNAQNSVKSSSAGGSAEGSTAANEEKAILTEYAQKLYLLKATYLGRIGNLIDQAKADHKNGMSNKELVSKYLGTAASLEGEADSQVNALLSELTQKLNSIGADTSIVNTMRSAYENEKSLKKSYYLSLYNNKK